MRGLWLDRKGLRLRHDLPEPPVGEGDALLEVMLAGICGTDLELLQGYAGFEGTPGHEFVARVLEGPDDLVGRRVVAEINITCGHCELCRAGLGKHCLEREVVGIRRRGGAFAERLSVPAANCHPVPDSIDDTAAVLVEPLAAALEIEETLQPTAGDRVLVVGAGRLGTLIALSLAATGCDLEVLVRSEQRRKLLTPAGIRCVSSPSRGYDIVVEASGNPAGLAIALEAVRPRGSVVMKSTFAGALEVDMSTVVVNEIRIIGSRCGPFDKALDWLARDRIDLGSLDFARFPLDDYRRAFDQARVGQPWKVMLEP